MKYLAIILCILSLLLAGCATEEPTTEQVTPEEVVTTEPAEEPIIIEEPAITEPIIKEPTKTKTKYESGPLNDMMREYSSRKYTYNGKSFGTTEKDYTGPALIMDAEESLNMRVFNIIPVPEKYIAIELNFNTDEYEITGMLKPGDNYVSRQGWKITITDIQDHQFNFTLSKVSKDEHKGLCPTCIKRTDLREDDGVRFARSNKDLTYTIKGDSYLTNIYNLNKATQKIQLKIKDEILPILPRNTNYILRNGQGIRYLFGAAHDQDNADYGYAAFGFVDSYKLPNNMHCPDCDSFAYLIEGTEQSLRIDNIIHKLKMDKSTFYYDGMSKELSLNKTIEIKPGLTATLLTDKEPYVVGMKSSKGIVSSVYCRESGDTGLDVTKVGKVKLAVGSEENLFERTDFCLDNNTLVEYACEVVPGRTLDKLKGKGYRAIIRYEDCNCKDGVCV